MASFQATTTLLGAGLAASILYLIRRDHLYLMHGLFWGVIAVATAVLGAWPGLINHLAAWTGFAYPPALLLLLACIVLLVKALHADMLHTRVERDLRRVNQRVALLEAELDALASAVQGLPPTTHTDPQAAQAAQAVPPATQVAHKH